MDLGAALQAGKESLWALIKKLPYDDGPSSTRWVFVTSAATISLGTLLLFATFCVVYWRTGKADLVFAGLIGTTTTALIGFASNALNTKHTLAAQVIAPDAGVAKAEAGS
jgi:hypothetical protein